MLALTALLASCATAPKRSVEPGPAPAPPPPPTAPNGITIAAVGDIMLGTDYPDNVLPDDDGVGFLAGITPILSAADITFGNLEGVLMDGGEAVKRCKPASKRKTDVTNKAPAPTAAPAPSPPDTAANAPEPQATSPAQPDASDLPAPPTEEASTGDATNPTPGAAAAASANTPEPAAPPTAEAPPTPAPAGSCFVFRSPTRYANYLHAAGFDVASLANNHAQDFGDAGRDSTMRTLDAVGIRHSGRIGDVAEWTTRGRRFALVAFAPNIGSHQLNDLAGAREIVKQLAARHDIVIVSFHGGGEGEGAAKLPFAHEIYQGEDRGDVVEFAHAVVDAGADLVIGHGPHVLRPLELYHERLIAYSLGNFATYYGISVNGVRGIAAVLVARIAADGRFIDGTINPTVQIRPAGPTLDPQRRAVTLLRNLTNEAFPDGTVVIADNGRVTSRTATAAAHVSE